MNQDDARRTLTEVGKKRHALAEALAEVAATEEAAIINAWRAGLPPTEIAQLAHRSPAHVRSLRPDDVPPARLGGGAAKPRPGHQK